MTEIERTEPEQQQTPATDIELFFDAIKDGRVDDVKALIRDKGVDVNARNDKGFTSLQVAVFNDDVEIAEWLIANGACIHIRDRDGNSALHLAAHDGNLAIVDCLLANDANRYATNEEGKPGETPVHFAGWNKNIDVVKRLIVNSEDANLETTCGYTIMHYVGEAGTVAVAEYLLSIGANLNTSSHHFTPLHFAAYYGNLEVVRGFVAAGASVQAKDEFGKTPLDYAREGDETAVVEFFESLTSTTEC